MASNFSKLKIIEDKGIEDSLGDYKYLTIKVLRDEPLMLYYLCRRGSWRPGKGHFDERGIIKDIEMSSKKFATKKFWHNKKKISLLWTRRRINWPKSIHFTLAKYCDLTKEGKILYEKLNKINAIRYIQEKFDLNNLKNFINNLLKDFNIKITKKELILIELDYIRHKTGQRIPLNKELMDKHNNCLKMSFHLKTHKIQQGNTITAYIQIKCRKCGNLFSKEIDRQKIEGNLIYRKNYLFICRNCNKIFHLSYNFNDFGEKKEDFHRQHNLKCYIQEKTPPFPRLGLNKRSRDQKEKIFIEKIKKKIILLLKRKKMSYLEIVKKIGIINFADEQMLRKTLKKLIHQDIIKKTGVYANNYSIET